MDCLEDTYINGFSIHIEYQSTLEDAHLFLNKLITLLQKDTIPFRFDYYSVDQEGNATSKEFTLYS
jgi:predicted Zn-dependent protease